MKMLRTRITQLPIPLLASCFTAVCMAQEPVQPMTARITRVHGDARYGATTNAWRPARTGDVLNEGAWIQTGKKRDSFLDVVIGEGRAEPQALIRLWADTALRLDELISRGTGNERTAEVQLDFPAGRITGKIGNLATGSKFEVKLPREVLGIRPPSVFEVISDGSASVVSGTMVIVSTALTNPVGGAIVVNSGKKFDAKSETVVTLPESERRDLENSLVVPGEVPPRRLNPTGPLQEPRPQRKF